LNGKYYKQIPGKELFGKGIINIGEGRCGFMYLSNNIKGKYCQNILSSCSAWY
jgi:hypothetical protein